MWPCELLRRQQKSKFLASNPFKNLNRKKSESLEDIYTQKSVKSPVIATKALATIAEKDSGDPFSKLKRKRLMVFPTDPSHRKVRTNHLISVVNLSFQPRKRKLTESIKRAAKIRKVSLENDKDKILKEKLEQLEKDLEDIEEAT